MRITLTTWERIQLVQIVGMGRGNFAQIERGLQALEVLRLTSDEMLAINYRAIGPGQVAWDVNQEYELEFDDQVWQVVVALTRAYQAWPMDERAKPLRAKVLGSEL